ncbi:MAG TPA: 4'-phosphopantetheinyl transferase superfamily protein [Verrucomicrobiales bacterium]|nr:4'-phosphopantetheinyl transferase superfamily protein [Verrucomicrobiales bacterium]
MKALSYPRRQGEQQRLATGEMGLPIHLPGVAPMPEPQWVAPGRDSRPLSNAAEVWRARSRTSEEEITRLQHVLSDAECSQAERFRRSVDRACFVTSHALLRLLLSVRLDVEPRLVVFATSKHGKPHLTPSLAADPIFFNMTHSQGAILIALSGREIGIDAESPKDIPEVLDIAERFFSTEEANALRYSQEEVRRTLFFRFWTMKEAVLKLTGSGIAGGLDSFSLPAVHHSDPFAAPVSWNVEGRARYPEWSATRVVSFSAWPDVPAAVAWQPPLERLRFFEGDPLLIKILQDPTAAV